MSLCSNAIAQDHIRWIGLRNEIARMVRQIQAEDRSCVAVVEFRVDREDLQQCLGRPVTHAIMRFLLEFGFNLVERGPLQLHLINNEVKLQFSPLMNQSTMAQLGKRNGAKSILTGTIDVSHEYIDVNCRFVRVETADIIGVGSCRLPKRYFEDLLRIHELDPPTVGGGSGLPEPRRLY